MSDNPGLSRESLRAYFLASPSRSERLGLEVELAAVDPSTGISRPYDGPSGIAALLTAIAADQDWQDSREAGALIGLKRPDGATLTLEPGGAVEYSSAPGDDLVGLIERTREDLSAFAAVADSQDTALLAAGALPFNRLEAARWMPKARYAIMRAYFASLGPPAALAWRMMTQTLSVQVSFDYLSEADLAEKMTAATVAAPIATALFANSPIEEGRVVEALSRRGQIWLATDPQRCGFVPPATRRPMSLDAYIDWALEVPMMFRVREGEHIAMHGKRFSAALREGFGDGERPDARDWGHQISGIFTDVRLKNVVEVRAMDGQAWENIPAVAAFWTGLLYHPPSRDAAWQLLGGIDLDERQRSLAESVVNGLDATLDGRPLLTIARALLDLAEAGLQARVDAGIERPEALGYLAPIQKVAASGRTLAADLIDEWRGPMKEDPAAFVERYRIPH